MWNVGVSKNVTFSIQSESALIKAAWLSMVTDQHTRKKMERKRVTPSRHNYILPC